MINNLNYISLFSAAGVGCYGFKLEKFKCVATCELLEKRIKIQKNNNICENNDGYITGDISTPRIQKKIIELSNKFKIKNNFKNITLILATPPCQGISVANHKKKNEINRNSLIVQSFMITKNVLPKFFIFENVQGFLKTLCMDVDGDLIPIETSLKKKSIK